MKVYYKPLKGITRYYGLRFTATDRNAVYVRETSDGPETRIVIGKSEPSISSLPLQMNPAGFSSERYAYLQRTVKPLVSAEHRHDYEVVLEEE